ncbi:MAG: S8 family serine peptidase [Pseudomonadota bacterium]
MQRLARIALVTLLFAAPAAAEISALGPQSTAVAADGRAMYIVQLASPAALARSGRAPRDGQLPLKPGADAPEPRKDGRVASAAAAVESEQQSVLRRAGITSAALHHYRYVFNGFAVRLTPGEAARLRGQTGVTAVFADASRSVATNASPAWLGLFDNTDGLSGANGLTGEGIVIGIVDSGITPDAESFRDTREADRPRACRSEWARVSLLGRWLCARYRRRPAVLSFEPPENWGGACVAGEQFTADDCNNKLIGARFYPEGAQATGQLDAGEILSARDADGHGTHIAATAAGNPVRAILNGSDVDGIRGIAPRARIAAYKACWLRPGATRASCQVSDLVRAIDDAVADGVDIINYSIGTNTETLANADDVALLEATRAGVLVVVAAGNNGPLLGTVGSPAASPWVISVAATSRTGSRFREASEILTPPSLAGRYASTEAQFTPQLTDTGSITANVVRVDDGDTSSPAGEAGSIRDGCQTLTNANEVDGRIALIARGACTFDEKITNAETAGAVAAIVFNTTGDPVLMVGDGTDINIPAVSIGAADAALIVDALADGETVQATLAAGLFLSETDPGNRVANFSSRGPSLAAQAVLKPDVAAPGVDILAAMSPDVANGTKGQRYGYLSGTSMAAPHVAGVAALLAEAHPDWTPDMLRSALMTTARQDIVTADGVSEATPFDIGAGHIVPNAARTPGLVYPATGADYDAFVCGIEDYPIDAARCNELAAAGASFDPQALNQPAMAVPELTSSRTITRTVTATRAGNWRARLLVPIGFTASVTPGTLSLAAGESAQYAVTLTAVDAAPGPWYAGAVEWIDSDDAVTRIPLVARPVEISAPRELSGAGGSGSVDFDLSFGFSGGYSASVFGLKPATLTNDSVANDPTRTFTPRNGSGVVGYSLNVPVGALYLRLGLFDSDTDGNDDLDLYLFFCPTPGNCERVDESGSATSAEQIDLAGPAPGAYEVYVHGFETDEVSGGPGANFTLSTWLVTNTDQPGNLTINGPSLVSRGTTETLSADWQALVFGNRYFGIVVHEANDEAIALTRIQVIN